jgi:hypothetical protein
MQSSYLISPSFSSIQFLSFARSYLRVEVVIWVSYYDESMVLDVYASVIYTIFFSSKSSKR